MAVEKMRKAGSQRGRNQKINRKIHPPLPPEIWKLDSSRLEMKQARDSIWKWSFSSV
jgi:hypothetical protein